MSQLVPALVIFLFVSLSATAVCADTVTVAGSGGMIPLLTSLADAYMKKNPHDRIKVSHISLNQSGGILAAKTGAVDIGMSARMLEVRELDATVYAYHIADVAADIAVHANVRLANISSQQLCDIYSGKITNWRQLGGHDAHIIVLTRPETDSTKEALRAGVACFENLYETPAAITMLKSNDMLSVLLHTRDTIGVIDSIALKQAHGRAHSLRLDHRVSSPEEVRSGRWPIIKKYTLVTRKNRSKGVDRFMRFIRSEHGTTIISKNDGIPVKFSYP